KNQPQNRSRRPLFADRRPASPTPDRSARRRFFSRRRRLWPARAARSARDVAPELFLAPLRPHPARKPGKQISSSRFRPGGVFPIAFSASPKLSQQDRQST